MTEKRGKNITYASRHMSTLWNPFSYKNNEPKYPDGLAQYSIGQKYTNHFVVEGEQNVIVLYPGLVGSVAAFRPRVNGEDDGEGAVVAGVSLHADNGNLFTRKETTYPDPDATPEQQRPMITLDPDPRFSAWRPVSYALKIMPVSNHQAIECGKDGWWEAIRVQGGINQNEWGVHGFLQNDVLYNVNMAVPVRGFGELHSTPAERLAHGMNPEEPHRYAPQWINGKGYLQPSRETVSQFQASDGWTLQPSYAKGCIRDIQCWTFQLNGIRRDNPFIDIRGVSIIPIAQQDQNEQYDPYTHTQTFFSLDTETWYGNFKAPYLGTLTTVQRNLVNYEIPNLTAQEMKLPHLATIEGYDSLHADSFDTIVIKLHGRENTKFLVQCVANLEYLAYNESSLQNFTTTSYAALEELAHYMDVRANDHKFPNHNYYKDKINL